MRACGGLRESYGGVRGAGAEGVLERVVTGGHCSVDVCDVFILRMFIGAFIKF